MQQSRGKNQPPGSHLSLPQEWMGHALTIGVLATRLTNAALGANGSSRISLKLLQAAAKPSGWEYQPHPPPRYASTFATSGLLDAGALIWILPATQSDRRTTTKSCHVSRRAWLHWSCLGADFLSHHFCWSSFPVAAS